MHEFRLGALSDALVLADAVVAYIGAIIPSSQSSGVVATLGVLVSSPSLP
jgi:dsRNA-specific ribonuclease